jgi:putative oxidoreductase
VTGSQLDRTALAARLAAGAVFVVFGIGKFLNHAAESSSFESYGLPEPSTFATAIGVIEVAGGALLIAGVATRAVALVLAGDMVGAIVVSGIAKGEAISLTLAPVLLVICLWLARVGAGGYRLAGRSEL